MKKGKLNIPSRPPVAGAAPNAATNLQRSMMGQFNPTANAPRPQLPPGQRPSIMVAVPAREMVNAEFAQHLAMACANMVANGIKINCAFNIGSVITIARRNLVDIFMKSDFDYIW